MSKATRAIGGGSDVATTVISIDTGRVRPFADQPREYFDAGELISLELSIKQRGQLMPAMVRKVTGDRDHDYELVDGQRRWHACSKLGVPLRAMIIDPEDPEDQFEISVAANFQRAEHTPMEIAKAIERMCTQGKRTEEYVGTLFGKTGSWVNQYRKLNDLVPSIQAQIGTRPDGTDSKIPLQVAFNLARLPREQQEPMLEEIQARGLTTARAVDKIRRTLLNDAPDRRARPADHATAIERLVRGIIERADLSLDRMGPDDFRLMVSSLVKVRKFDRLRETVMTAIGRLETIHRRLVECNAALAGTTVKKAEPVKAAPLRAHLHAYSPPMKCPKCNVHPTRFRRRIDADVAKDSWVCLAKGCELKISRYNIKIDKTYQPEAAAAGA